MARTPEQRGPFGRWLVAERKRRGWTADEMRARLMEARGFAMAHSTYALLESGQRQPTEEQREHLTAFLGSQPERSQEGSPDDLLAVVRQQTTHIEALTGAIERQSQDIAALLALVERLMPRPSTPAVLPEIEEDEPGDDGLSRAALAGDRLARYETAQEAGGTPPASPRPPSALRTPARRTTP